MCGMTDSYDIALAIDAGVDAVGVIFAQSQRRVDLGEIPTLLAAIPPLVAKIAVVSDASSEQLAELAAHGFTFQFCGDENPETCEAASRGESYLKVRHLAPDQTFGERDIADLDLILGDYRRAMWLFDTRVTGKRGGTGVSFPWHALEPLARRRPIVISGGLTVENVGACVRAVRPYAVDVRSGVEKNGRKDPDRMRAFVLAVREADAATA